MNILVLVKVVPDLVEELLIDKNGRSLETTWLRLLLNEFDEHAAEQALLLKERIGGQVTVIAPDAEEIDEALYTLAAKGIDHQIKLVGDFDWSVDNHTLARLLIPVIQDQNPDLVMTGVQAHNDLDGQLGPLVAAHLGWPYVGYVAGVQVVDGRVTVGKEFPGGLMAEMVVGLPAVLGIQSAESPPRYVAFSKVRQAMNTAVIKEIQAVDMEPTMGTAVGRLSLPTVTRRATMIEGSPDEIAMKLIDIMHAENVLGGGR